MEVLEVEKKEKEPQEEVPDVVKWLNQLKNYRKPAPEKAIIVPYKEDSQSKEVSDEIKTKTEEPGEEFKDLVDKEAYFISLNQLSYNELVWLLAEKELSLKKGYDNVTEEEIRNLAKEIFDQCCSYDELCWLNGELIVLHEKYNL
jgi:hypothetical protein